MTIKKLFRIAFNYRNDSLLRTELSENVISITFHYSAVTPFGIPEDQLVTINIDIIGEKVVNINYRGFITGSHEVDRQTEAFRSLLITYGKFYELKQSE